MTSAALGVSRSLSTRRGAVVLNRLARFLVLAFGVRGDRGFESNCLVSLLVDAEVSRKLSKTFDAAMASSSYADVPSTRSEQWHLVLDVIGLTSKSSDSTSGGGRGSRLNLQFPSLNLGFRRSIQTTNAMVSMQHS